MVALPKHVEVEENYLHGGGILGWLTTIDHKRIGVLYGVTTLFFFLMGGIEALLMRIQLARPENTFLSAYLYNEMFTMHGTTMIFLVVMPVGLGFFANFLVPLQIGARDVAFPRLNALSYWIFLFGALVLNIGWLANVVPDAGWFGYANLTERYYSPGINIDFWSLGLLISGVGSVLSGLNLLVTVVNLRAPGMTFMRMPLFVWSVLVMFVLVLVAFPPLTVGLIFLVMDRFFGTHFYLVVAGATPLLWQHLFWLFGHPEVYIMVLPAFGIMSEIVPVFSRKPLYGYPVMAYSTALIGFLSYGVWAHHMFAVGMGPVADSAFALTSMLIAIPTGIKIFSWIATMWGGDLKMKTPFLFALAFIVQFTMGGLSGIMHAQPPVDLQQTDSYFVVAHFHYVLFGGSAFALLGGLYYWWPKVTGRLLDERLGKLNFWTIVIGFNLTFFPMHLLGGEGMPRRIYHYAPDMGWNTLNLLCTLGAFTMAFSVLILLINIFKTIRGGELAGPDPWDGRTLEWKVPSPPPEYNFRQIPTVRARDQFWREKYGFETGGLRPSDAVRPPATPPEPAGKIHMPAPSIYPILLAAGIAMAALGMIIWTRIALCGAFLTVYCAIAMAFEYPEAGAESATSSATATGQDTRKVGIWSFIGSESLFFASLIATYLIYKGRDLGGPTAETILEVPLSTVTTFVLLMSSLTMVLAQDAYRRTDRVWGLRWLCATIVLGLIFLGGQVYEFDTFFHKGMTLQTNLFSQTFYTMVGFHGAHVAIGVIVLLALACASLTGWFEQHHRDIAVECAALYWHFVDIVWVVIFSIVYLMRAVTKA
jgi:cytochrome c oxidase subunit I